MIYLDANIFIFAATNTEEKGDQSRLLIKNIREGKAKAATSALTFDEVVWKVKQERGSEAALAAGKAILEMRNLLILDVTESILWEAYRLIAEYKLDPRDAIHAASCLVHGIVTIVSEDIDFDKVKELHRKYR